MRKPGHYVSYAWALHLDATDVNPDDLTPSARAGLEYAEELAQDAYERSLDPRREQELERLTIEQLATEENLQPTQIARWIQLARHQLFGDLSDGAIYKRLQRQRGRKPRRCGQPGCKETIPVTAPANKHYCDQHRTGKARTWRSRHR